MRNNQAKKRKKEKEKVQEINYIVTKSYHPGKLSRDEEL